MPLFVLVSISVKKNLIGALIFLKEVQKQYKITFTVIGPIGEESYWKECELLIKKLPKKSIEVQKSLSRVLYEQARILDGEMPSDAQKFSEDLIVVSLNE